MIPVVRMIARLNVGGPAIHTILLTKLLNPSRFSTTLVTGTVSLIAAMLLIMAGLVRFAWRGA